MLLLLKHLVVFTESWVDRTDGAVCIAACCSWHHNLSLVVRLTPAPLDNVATWGFPTLGYLTVNHDVIDEPSFTRRLGGNHLQRQPRDWTFPKSINRTHGHFAHLALRNQTIFCCYILDIVAAAGSMMLPPLLCSKGLWVGVLFSSVFFVFISWCARDATK